MGNIFNHTESQTPPTNILILLQRLSFNDALVDFLPLMSGKNFITT